MWHLSTPYMPVLPFASFDFTIPNILRGSGTFTGCSQPLWLFQTLRALLIGWDGLGELFVGITYYAKLCIGPSSVWVGGPDK